MRNIWKLLAAFALAGGLAACSKDSGTSAPGNITISDNFTAVDLGLSVKWANLNIGAKNEDDAGEYFAWGETSVKSITKYTKDDYKFYDASGRVTKYCESALYGTVDGKCELESGDDAATVILGKGWRMPTYDECHELIDKCTFEVTTSPDNQTQHITVTGPNGNKIVFVQRNNISGLADGKTNTGALNLWTKSKGWDMTEEISKQYPGYSDTRFDFESWSLMIALNYRLVNNRKQYSIDDILTSRQDRCSGYPIRAVKDK